MLRRLALVILIAAAFMPLAPAPARAQATDLATPAASASAAPVAASAGTTDASRDPDQTADGPATRRQPDIGAIATLLASVFALAAVLEAALAVIFAWPVFLDRINRRNAKMPISLLLGFVVAKSFDLDLVEKLGAAFGAGNANLNDWFDASISALLLAGGGAGVRNLMVSLGLAMPTAELERPPKPPGNRAWLSVRDARTARDLPLTIWLSAADSAGVQGKPFIIGTIGAKNRMRMGLARMFLIDRSRFPVVAGYAVDVGNTYDIYVEQGTAAPEGDPQWRDYAFGEGAIVDLSYA